MSDGIPARKLLTAALKQMLMDASGCPAEIARAPWKNNDTNIVADTPYAIIYPIPGGPPQIGTPLYHPNEDMVFVYQITTIGERPDQTEWMADKIRWAILGRDNQGAFRWSLAPTGLTVMDRDLATNAGGLTPSDDNRIFSVVESYFFYVTTS